MVSATGAVNRPDTDATVTLTATVSSGSAHQSKDFEVRVQAALTDEQKLREAVAALTVTNLSDVRGNLTLPIAGRHGSTIDWASADETVIDTSGLVHRPPTGSPAARVTLTATLTLGIWNAEKALTAVVPALPAAAPLKATRLPTSPATALPGRRSISPPARATMRCAGAS